MTAPIFTEKHSCRDCYKCVRHCPVKAISVKEGSALVNPDLCIYCGRCVEICPAGAKKVRSDLPRAIQLVKIKDTSVSLSPSFYSEFGEEAPGIISFLKQQGVYSVSDTALGAEYLNRDLTHWLSENSDKTWISTACPVIVDYVHLYRPDLLESLTPMASPMVIHGEILKEEALGDRAVIFIGPCIAKKREADRNSSRIDVALSFKELNQWIEQEGGLPETIDEVDYEKAAEASLYPLDGGMIGSMRAGDEASSWMALSGMERVVHALKDIGSEEDTGFLECLACSGGCINGPGRINQGDFLKKQARIKRLQKERTGLLVKDRQPTTFAHALDLKKIENNPFTEKQIELALIRLDKGKLEDRLNCGGCGYSSCREFAISFLDGKSEREMCAGNMRKLAQKKVNALIRTIPIAVVMVDQDLQIVELNGPFLKYFSDADMDDYHEINRVTRGLKVSRFAPLDTYFQNVLEKTSSLEKRLYLNGSVYQAIFFTIEEGRLAGGTFQDITKPAIHRDTIIAKAEEVIMKNLESVQQIASVLGENAAETEIILNSVIDALKPQAGGRL